ncbi:hypothetical protein QL285_052074 [Trifolium repens]|nr:hypothetical protein QL285_052074 [Trifolium repens]
MTMAATAFKIKKNSDRKTKDMLVMGFTGQLKGWWDNILSEEDKLQIDSAIKMETNEEICVTTLLYAITKLVMGFTGQLKGCNTDFFIRFHFNSGINL